MVEALLDKPFATISMFVHINILNYKQLKSCFLTCYDTNGVPHVGLIV